MNMLIKKVCMFLVLKKKWAFQMDEIWKLNAQDWGKHIHQSAAFGWVSSGLTHFRGPHKQIGRSHRIGKTCGNAVFNDPSILSCPFHMLPMNYVSAVIYGAPHSTPFFSLNVESCMDFSPGANWEKQNCSI